MNEAHPLVPFDPFTATLQQAMAFDEEMRASGVSTLIAGPMMRWQSAQTLIVRRKFYEKNPLDGIAVCAVADLVMPDWLARAFLSGFYAVANCQVGSWDEAFGCPLPKGGQLAARRRDRVNLYRVWNLVNDYTQRCPDSPLQHLWDAFDVNHAGGNGEVSDVPADLAAEVRAIGMASTKAQELFAEACEVFRYTHAEIRNSLGRPPIVPAKFRKVAGRKKASRK